MFSLLVSRILPTFTSYLCISGITTYLWETYLRMCPSLAPTCSWRDTCGNTTTCCGFHPRLDRTSGGRRLTTAAWLWKVMTGALWKSTLKDATPQVHVSDTCRSLDPVTHHLHSSCGVSFSVCGAGPAEPGGEHHPPVAARQRHGGRGQPGCQL